MHDFKVGDLVRISMLDDGHALIVTHFDTNNLPVLHCIRGDKYIPENEIITPSLIILKYLIKIPKPNYTFAWQR